MTKTVVNKCQNVKYLSLDSITPLVEDFRKINKTNSNKLREAFKHEGFLFPLYVWKNGKATFIIDGVNRWKALKDLVADGWEVKQVPVVFVEAKNRREAKKRVAYASSRYAVVNPDAFKRFLGGMPKSTLVDRVEIIGAAFDYESEGEREKGAEAKLHFNSTKYKKFIHCMEKLRVATDWQSDAEIIIGLLESYKEEMEEDIDNE